MEGNLKIANKTIINLPFISTISQECTLKIYHNNMKINMQKVINCSII